MQDEDGRNEGATVALDSVIDEVVGLFHLLRAVAEELHGQGDLTAGRRGVLRGLDRYGPQTVPQMARARPVSRQHIQMLVNQLEAEGLVELRENAAHKRSRLVALTPRGKALLEAMYRRELDCYERLAIPNSPEALQSTADSLHSLREALSEALLRLRRGETG